MNVQLPLIKKLSLFLALTTIAIFGQGIEIMAMQDSVSVTPSQLSAELYFGQSQLNKITIKNNMVDSVGYKLSIVEVQNENGLISNLKIKNKAQNAVVIEDNSPNQSRISKQLESSSKVFRANYQANSNGINVLILRDGGSEYILQQQLMNDGYNVTVPATFEYQYDGTNPNINDFDVLVLLNGQSYNQSMPEAGQQAILDFVKNGGGLIATEWISYEIVNRGQYQLLKNYLPLLRTTGFTSSDIWTPTGEHPITAGVTSFSLEHGASGMVLQNEGTTVVTGSLANQAVAYKKVENGMIVQFASAPGYFNIHSFNNPQLYKLLTNSINWVTEGSISWANINPSKGVIQSNEEIEVEFNFVTNSTLTGEYSANVIISFDNEELDTIIIPVILQLNAYSKTFSVDMSKYAEIGAFDINKNDKVYLATSNYRNDESATWYELEGSENIFSIELPMHYFAEDEVVYFYVIQTGDGRELPNEGMETIDSRVYVMTEEDSELELVLFNDVEEFPIISTSLQPINLDLYFGDALSIDFTVESSGSHELKWEIELDLPNLETVSTKKIKANKMKEETNWISVDTYSGSLINDSFENELNIITGGLPLGEQSTTLTIKSNDLPIPSVNIPINVNIKGYEITFQVDVSVYAEAELLNINNGDKVFVSVADDRDEYSNYFEMTGDENIYTVTLPMRYYNEDEIMYKFLIKQKVQNSEDNFLFESISRSVVMISSDQVLEVVLFNDTNGIPKLELSQHRFQIDIKPLQTEVASVTISNTGSDTLHWVFPFYQDYEFDASRTVKSKPIVDEISNSVKSKNTGKVSSKNANQSMIENEIPGLFEKLADTPVELTAFTIDPTTQMMYAQQNQGNEYYQFNPFENAWSALTSSPVYSGNNGGAIYLNGKIYISYTNRDSLAIYDIDSNSWTKIYRPSPVRTGNITTDGNLLYFVGEYSFVSYNPTSEEVVELAEPPFYFESWGGLLYTGTVIYALQGNGEFGFAKFNVANNEWEELEDTPAGSVLGSAYDPIHQSIYTYGDYENSYFMRYDIRDGAWAVSDLDMFEYVDDGGMVYSSHPEVKGIYIIEGEAGVQFYRFMPRNSANISPDKVSGVLVPNESELVTFEVIPGAELSGGIHKNIALMTNDPRGYLDYLSFELWAEYEAEIELSLQSGWHLLGIPILMENDSISSILTDNTISIIEGYNDGYTQWVQNSETNNLLRMEYGQGYWVYVPEESNFIASGMVVNPSRTIQLKKGVNLVSWLPDFESDIEYALSSILPYVELVHGFGETGKSYVPEVPFYQNSLQYVYPGQALLIVVKEDVNLNYPFLPPTIYYAKMSSKTREIGTKNVNDGNVTNRWSTVYATEYMVGGQYVSAESNVYFKTEDGLVVGSTYVSEGGVIYPTEIYGDNPHTEEVDGAVQGEWIYIHAGELVENKAFIYSGYATKVDLNNTITSVPDNEVVPTGYSLLQNYPNPFNPTTQILFNLPISGKTKLTVYNVLGVEVATLVNRDLQEGTHAFTWNGKTEGGMSVASGVYLYKLESGGFSKTKKMMLLK